MGIKLLFTALILFFMSVLYGVQGYNVAPPKRSIKEEKEKEEKKDIEKHVLNLYPKDFQKEPNDDVRKKIEDMIIKEEDQ